jgi:hypothetical protein
MFEDTPLPLIRFYSYLSNKPRWGHEKELLYINKKENIIEKAAYIELPSHRRHYLSFDLDYECAANVWIDEGLPEPTITIVNNENSHATLHYELTVPILLPIENRSSRVSYKAIRFYNSVREGLRCRMNGDKGYAGFNTKNPFLKSYKGNLKRWKVFCADKTYDLQYLNEFCCHNAENFEILDIDPNSRHMTMFDSCRKHAYRIVKKFSCYDQFNAAVHQLCNDFHSRYLAHIKKNHEFYPSEINSIARSIAKWTWSKRNDPNFSNFTKNRGAMNFLAIDANKSSLGFTEEVKLRQQQGAKYTHEARKSKTKEKITAAMQYLTSNGIQISMNELSKLTKLSTSTLYRYQTLIDSLDIQ